MEMGDAITGCILGCAVGDAMGLPYEGLTAARGRLLLGPPSRHRFLWGHGMVSDDTEHTCMVAQCLIESGDDIALFVRRLAGRLRWWILGLPAGVGKATAVSIARLWLGARPERSGVFSAGNGPAMRAAIFGAAIDDQEQMLRFVRASSLLTHSDPRAFYGAMAVALAAREARMHLSPNPEAFLDGLMGCCGAFKDDSNAAELAKLVVRVVESVTRRESTTDFAAELGCSRGVSGYTYHTVPVAIHAWLSHPQDFQTAVHSTIECGGDADTTAAIVGAIVGTGVGRRGIPQDWLAGIWEWPRSAAWMSELAAQLGTVRRSANRTPQKSLRLNPVPIFARNLFFLAVVLCHGLRRLAPPYR